MYATLDYRKGTDDWSEYSFNTEINLADGEFVQFQAREGGNDSFAIVHSEETTFYPSVWCFGEGLIKVSGNIMSLLDRSLQSSSLRKESVS